MNKYPQYEITKIKEKRGITIISGVLDRTHQGREIWIADDRSGYLIKKGSYNYGWWYKKRNHWQFE